MNEKNQLVKMFEVLLEEHTPMLVSYLSAMTGSVHDAQDLAQDTFIRAYQNFDQFGGRGSNFAAWIRTIARNLVIDRSRVRKLDLVTDSRVLDGIEDVFGATDEFGRGDDWETRILPLRECFDSMSDRLQEVCAEHYLKGQAPKNVAAQLGVTLSAVLKRLERARKSLRDCMTRKLGLSSAESCA